MHAVHFPVTEWIPLLRVAVPLLPEMVHRQDYSLVSGLLMSVACI